MSDLDDLFSGGISGSGGSSSSKGASSSSNESDNTLRSDNRAKLLELISEGPCVGLVNGGTSIYLDQTPVVNASGSANFRGVQWDVRLGTPDQPAIPGNATVETPFSVGVTVQNAVGPVLRTINDANTAQVRVVVEVQALAYTNSQGEIKPNSVSWQIQVRPVNGNWVTVDQVDLIDQKCTSPYQQASLINLPQGGCPWDIQVVRLTPDSTTVENQNTIVFLSYTEIVAGSFTYPNSALVYLDIDASLFDSSSIPTRAYDWKGMIIQVPSNYDPVYRDYYGMWDGTFVNAWTDNPAWIFYDLVTNDRYGLGQYVDATKVDKWSLYQIAQYCDQYVPDGFGGTEPRYTFNATISSRDEAYRVLQSITAAWRGMAFWSLGTVFATIDAPSDPVKLVSPANVVGGHFTYSGTALKARHSVALVSWQDPNDFYRPAVEVVINNAMLEQYGWRETTIQAIGCTSRGLAHRYGKWLLDTEQNETETVSYQASWDHATVKPGDIIWIADPSKAGTRTGGRIAAVADGAQQVTLDKKFEPEASSTYNFMCEGPEGGIQQRQIVEFLDDGEIVLASPLANGVAAGAMWVITGTDVVPRRYRVLSVKEDDKHLFTITALFHDPTKYARVEDGIFFNPLPYYRPKTTIDPPTNLQASQSLYQIDGHYASRILLSWTPGADFQSQSFIVTANSPNGFIDYGEVGANSMDIENSALGTYTFSVRGSGYSGQVSNPVTVTIEVNGWQAVGGPYVSGLEIQGQGADTTFAGRDCTIDWVNNFPNSGLDIAQDQVAGAGTANPFYRDNIITVQDADGNPLRSEVVTTDVYTYDFDKNAQDNAAYNRGPQRSFSLFVQVRNTLGAISEPDEITVSNPVPDMVVPVVTGGVDSVYLSYEVPGDRDYAGALVWMSQDPGFDPWSTTPVYDGPNNAISLPAANLETYYVRMACYDAFGKTGLNVCPPITVFTGNRIFDIEPPAVPTNLRLMAGTKTMPTGEVVSELTATWDASPSDNFGYFSVEIRDDDASNWIATSVDKPIFQWTGLVAGKAYDVQVRAFSVAGYPSAYATSEPFVMPAKTTAPGNPTNLTAQAAFKSLFLGWTNPADADLADVEVYVGPSADFTAAALVGKSYTNAFTYPVGSTGTTLYAWIRAANTSGLFSAFVGPVEATPSAIAHIDLAQGIIAAENIIAGTITSDQIKAGSIVGDSLAIDSYLPSTITVGKTGVTIGATTNPAALVNSGTTLIDPGKITIAGDTTLSDWRSGPDSTQINGGAIAANTITANKLTIGSRGITVSDLQFGYDKTKNIVTWTAGAIAYTDSAGATQQVQIPAGSYQWTPGTYQYPCVYVAWQEGASALTADMDITKVTGASFVQLATYRGIDNLVATYGRTVIDGSNIVAGSITAAQLYVGELITNAAQIDGGVIQNTHLAGNITFDKMAGGTLSTTEAILVGGTRFVIDAVNQRMTIRDTSAYNDGSGYPGRTRAIMGQLLDGSYGLALYDGSGNMILSSGSQMSASNISGLGPFATLNQIDATAASTYIQSAAITVAKIAALDTVWQTSTGALSVIDQNTGRQRVRVGAIPADGDFGLKVWDGEGNVVFSSTGLDGTYINEATIGTLSLINNSISVTAGAFAGGVNQQVTTSLSLDGDAQILITFTGTLIASANSTGQGTIYIDGTGVYTAVMISTSNAAVTGPVSMSYMVSAGAGNHNFRGLITGTAGVIQPHDLAITVTALKK